MQIIDSPDFEEHIRQLFETPKDRERERMLQFKNKKKKDKKKKGDFAKKPIKKGK